MRYIVLFISALLLATLSFGKGHCGGGHGGSHSGGHGHAASHGSAHGTSPGNSSERTGAPRNARASTSRQAARIANPNPLIVSKSIPPYSANGKVITQLHPGYTGYTFEQPAHYPYYYYASNPFFYSPYFSFASFGVDMLYTPHYNYASPANNNNDNDLYDVMDGYVVYANDTIAGAITLRPNTIFVENVDSGKNYDYKFHLNTRQLAFVSLYNTDSSQLCLTRVKEDPKKLWRIVHEGRLNVYDQRFAFIYRPEDIDVRSLMVIYQGEPQFIGSSSVTRTKLRLTEFINRVYNIDLDPGKFSWKELLIYLDKLD